MSILHDEPRRLVDPTAFLLRLAGLVALVSGMVGGYVWLVDLEDRSDGDHLRWGFWHNPFMQFPIRHEAPLEFSMWVLLACSAAAAAGGVMLLIPTKWGVPLVTWQARLSILTNGLIAVYIIVIMNSLTQAPWELYSPGTPKALALRLGSIAVDLVLWIFLSSGVVREYFRRQSHTPGRAFEVIVKGSKTAG